MQQCHTNTISEINFPIIYLTFTSLLSRGGKANKNDSKEVWQSDCKQTRLRCALCLRQQELPGLSVWLHLFHLYLFVPQCSSNTWRANRKHSKNSKPPCKLCKYSWRTVSTSEHFSIPHSDITGNVSLWAVEVEVDVNLVGLFSYSDYTWAHLFQVWTRTDDKTGMNWLTVEHLASVSQEFIK